MGGETPRAGAYHIGQAQDRKAKTVSPLGSSHSTEIHYKKLKDIRQLKRTSSNSCLTLRFSLWHIGSA
jgi:hypothetical protein